MLFIWSDILSGIQTAVESNFPNTVHQICNVYQIRNTLKFVSYKERKAVLRDVKAIYQADDIEMANESLQNFKTKWYSKYSSAVQSWFDNWDALTLFFNFPRN